jgi:hypothetical protein
MLHRFRPYTNIIYVTSALSPTVIGRFRPSALSPPTIIGWLEVLRSVGKLSRIKICCQILFVVDQENNTRSLSSSAHLHITQIRFISLSISIVCGLLLFCPKRSTDWWNRVWKYLTNNATVCTSQLSSPLFKQTLRHFLQGIVHRKQDSREHYPWSQVEDGLKRI